MKISVVHFHSDDEKLIMLQSSSIFIGVLSTCYLVYRLNDFSLNKILFTIAMLDDTYGNILKIYK